MTTFLINMLVATVSGILSIIPKFGGDSSWTQFGTNAGYNAGSINGYVPEHLAVTVLMFVLGLLVIEFAWRAAVFVYSMIPALG